MLNICSETKRKTLEEIAAAFGDKVVDVDKQPTNQEELGLEEKAKDEKIDQVENL